MITFFTGLAIGGILGVFCTALMQANAQRENAYEQYYDRKAVPSPLGKREVPDGESRNVDFQAEKEE